jgi:NitT/TauT family transport system ATP-binding protein
MSPTPGRIARIFEIPLSRPRDINSANLAGYASQIAAALKGNLLKDNLGEAVFE